MAELRWKKRCSESLILCSLLNSLSPALERWSASIPSSGSIFLCSLDAGQELASMALGRVGIALALVFQHVFAPLIGMKEMAPHRRIRDYVHLIARNTFVSLAHSCSSKGTALTSSTSSFQHVWTRMVTFWEESCKNEVVPVSGKWGVACKGRSNFFFFKTQLLAADNGVQNVHNLHICLPKWVYCNTGSE